MSELEHEFLSIIASNRIQNCNICALNRLAPEDFETLRTAQEFGFSQNFAYGVMDGWDDLAHNYRLFARECEMPGYTEGFALGQEAWLIRPEAQ